MIVFPRPYKNLKFRCFCILKSSAFPSQWVGLIVEKDMHTFTNVHKFVVGLGDNTTQHIDNVKKI